MTLFDRLRDALSDRYQLERELGRGGMATVYLAQDAKHHRPVAIKVLRPEIGAALGPERFLREIRTAASLQHPHILGLLDSGEVPAALPADSALLYYVMPYVEGESLRDRLVRERQLPVGVAVAIACQVAGALDYAHTRNLVHRDIKPENILLAGDQALLVDFGIAKAVSDSGGAKLTETGLAIGTPYYMSPEQASGDSVDGRTDQYALACVLYEMLAGTPPFQGSTGQAILARHAIDPVPCLRTVRSSVPESVEAAIGQALAKVPADRFVSTSSFADALTHGLTAPVQARRKLRRPLIVALACLGFLAAGLFLEKASGAGASSRITSLAVAPLENLTGDSAQLYLTQGMTEQLITDLSQIAALKVIRLNAAPSQDSSLAVARRLKLGAVLGGSLQRVGTSLHITVQLVSAGTGQALWGASHDGDLQNVFGLQEEVARSVADRIRIATTSEERTHLSAEKPSVSPPAYEAYLRGVYFTRRVTEADLHKAIDYFQLAINLEPGYAAAYAGLSEAYEELGYYDALIPRDAYPKARDAAVKALELDSTLAEAHVALARTEFFYEWRSDEAEREYRRALELNPRLAWCHLIYSTFLSARGRNDEAIAEALKAQELDPLSLLISAAAARAYYNAGRYDDAIAQASKSLEIDSSFSRAHFWRGLAYTEEGRLAEGIRELQLTVGNAPFPLYEAALGHAYAVAGQGDQARKILADLRVLSATRYVSPFGIATVYAGLRDGKATMDWLEKAYQDRASYLAFLRVDPQFRFLRTDSRFTDLLTRIELGRS